jgi:hypothetical protein
VIRVRYTSGGACGSWTLGVNGNTGGNDLSCD